MRMQRSVGILLVSNIRKLKPRNIAYAIDKHAENIRCPKRERITDQFVTLDSNNTMRKMILQL